MSRALARNAMTYAGKRGQHAVTDHSCDKTRPCIYKSSCLKFLFCFDVMFR
jgi:hypothetical protein